MSSEASETTAVAEPATQPSAAPKKGRKAAAPKPVKTKPKSDHPKVADMVIEAIETLKERKGSSVQAIKKFMAAHYTVEVDKLAPHIRKALKSAVESGKLVQTKGKGASGSFKLGQVEPKKAPSKKAAEKVKAEKPKAKKVAKSPVKVKVAKSPKKVAKVVKKSTAAVVKTPAKKPAKSPKAKVARKPKVKTPKPKTVKKTPAKKTKPVQKGSPAKKVPSRAAKK